MFTSQRYLHSLFFAHLTVEKLCKAIWVKNNNFLLQTIATAEESIHIATMLITRLDVANALIAAHSAGLDVNAVINDESSSTQYDILYAELGDEDLVDNADTNIIMHHKYMIVDEGTTSDPLLWVGSHNWMLGTVLLRHRILAIGFDAVFTRFGNIGFG